MNSATNFLSRFITLFNIMSGLKVALWGFGHMNKVILTYFQEKGYKVVAVFGHHDVGKDT
jgi:glutamate dehydrogenase/leucine dehydrogenase